MLWNPFLFNTEIYPAGQIMRTLDNIDFHMVVKYSPLIFKKVILNLQLFLKSFFYLNANLNSINWIFTLMSPFLTVLFIVSLFKRPPQKQPRLLHSMLTLLLLIVLVFNLFTITTLEMRYWHPFVPLLMIFATDMLIRLFKSLPSKYSRRKSYLNILVLAIMLIFILPGIAKNFLFNRELYKNKVSVYQSIGEVFKSHTKPNDIIVTNIDAWGTWYGRRRTIYYPMNLESLEDLEKYSRVDALLIFDDLFVDNYSRQIWSRLVNDPADFGNFKFVKRIDVEIGKNEFLKAALYTREL